MLMKEVTLKYVTVSEFAQLFPCKFLIQSVFTKTPVSGDFLKFTFL